VRLLLIEDNERLSSLIRESLATASFSTDVVATAGEAEAAIKSLSYGAVILDLGLPDEDGLSLLKRLRRSGSSLPILILTARGGIEDKVRGLDAGADDYLAKPFAQEELIARLRAMLRRPGSLLEDAIDLGTLRLDTVSRQVTVAGKPQSFSPREIAVLEVLLRRAGRVIPKKILEDHLFGMGDVQSNAVEVYVHRLRKQLADAGSDTEIHTVRGVGYLISRVP
jgi:DNA-binding response OmpR family regulator